MQITVRLGILTERLTPLGVMGDEMRGLLKPLGTILLCNARGIPGEPLMGDLMKSRGFSMDLRKNFRKNLPPEEGGKIPDPIIAHGLGSGGP